MDTKKTQSEIRIIQERLAGIEATTKWLIDFQQRNVKLHNELRAAVKKVIKSKWQHRCSDKIGGCTAVSDSQLDELIKLIRKTKPMRAVNPRVIRLAKKL